MSNFFEFFSPAIAGTDDAENYWEADRIIKELPEDLEALKSREWIIMDLDKACDFFGINFKKRRLFARYY
jgi:hypothetical protein